MLTNWVQGDTPLPLAVNMDLSDPAVTVEVILRDAHNPAGALLSLTPTKLSGTTGGITCAGVVLDTVGLYRIQTRVSRGTELVATFPNNRDYDYLRVRPSLEG